MTYRDNTAEMNAAINRSMAQRKYAKKQTQKDKHGVLDLTGLKNNNIGSAADGNGSSNKTLRATIGNRNNRPILTTIKENKGSRAVPDNQGIEDEYSKYNSDFDGFADEQLINSGATILHSEITITDSQGHNRTIVRRN